MFSRKTIESFSRQVSEQNLIETIELGLRTVEVKKIVGSVNRWQDFDAQFRFRLTSQTAVERYSRIKRAMEEGAIMPPVKLYKVRDKYYVLDGHHRIAAAKELGQIYVDAYVTEFLPVGDSMQHLLWRERAQFEYRTGLADIEFTELGMYQELLKQIEQFEQEDYKGYYINDSFFHVAKQWYEDIYLPVVKEIRKEKLLDDFPNRTEADLFLYATHHRIAKSRLLQEEVTYREALADLRPSDKKTLKEKILETIGSLLRLNDVPHDCPHGLIIDEDGLVRVTKDCEGCTKCNRGKEPVPGEPRIISEEDVEGYRKI
ncbi:MAG: ParB N-terminal domain-containing protein [Firmicutes bacterium]|nr:ParB N-terminal domain-containing protein [Bacillota bacterium]HKM17667.1 ParB/RepB/Spo0J family partition protein [Limnochordia bacterium]